MRRDCLIFQFSVPPNASLTLLCLHSFPAVLVSYLSPSWAGIIFFLKWSESSTKLKPFGFQFLLCPLLVYLLLDHTPALLHRTKYVYKNTCASLVPLDDMTSSCLFFPPALMFFLKMSPSSWRAFSPLPPPSSSSREGRSFEFLSLAQLKHTELSFLDTFCPVFTGPGDLPCNYGLFHVIFLPRQQLPPWAEETMAKGP